MKRTQRKKKADSQKVLFFSQRLLSTVDLGNGLKVQITTGPVITGTAIRDAMGIGFGEFANQIAYQNIGTALNNKSKTEVIAKLDLKSLEGKTLTFEGAFSASSVDEVLVVPTKLTVT